MENAKRAAAYKAVDDHVKDKSVIGIGSGATVAYAVQRLAERVKKGNLSVICIPGSFTARELILNNDLVLGDLESNPKLDFAIDGADEVDAKLNVINGGGGYFSQGKILAAFSKALIIVSDHTKSVKNFGGPGKRDIAVEVIPFARVPVREKIQSKFGGSVKLRIAPKTAKYDPDTQDELFFHPNRNFHLFKGPVVTDNGNFILDWDFPNDIDDWEDINTGIKLIPGVVETGIFVNLATKAYFGMEDGSVKVQTLKN